MAGYKQSQTDPPTPPIEKGSWQSPSNDAHLPNGANQPSGQPIESVGDAYMWAGKQFEDASQIIAQAMKTFKLGCSVSKATEDRLETRIKELERENIAFKNERDRAVLEAATLRDFQTHHEAELAKAKASELDLEEQARQATAKLHIAEKEKEDATEEATESRKKQVRSDRELEKLKAKHAEQFRKLKANLVAENSKEINDLKALHEKERSSFQRNVEEPKRLRQENQRLVIENKTLRIKADGNKEMKKTMADQKKLIEEQEEKYQNTRQVLDDVRFDADILRKSAAEEKTKNVDLKQEFERLKLDLDNEVKARKDLRGKNTILEMRVEKKVDEVADLQKELNTVAEEKEKYHKLWLEKDVGGQIKSLEADREAKAPLVNIGVRIRQRFMEQEGTRFGNFGFKPKDDQIIKLGNEAAHEMDEEADRAVFTLGYWSRASNKEKFIDIYGDDPDPYAAAVESWKRFERLIIEYARIFRLRPDGAPIADRHIRAHNAWVKLAEIGPKEKRPNADKDDLFEDLLSDFANAIKEMQVIDDVSSATEIICWNLY